MTGDSPRLTKPSAISTQSRTAGQSRYSDASNNPDFERLVECSKANRRRSKRTPAPRMKGKYFPACDAAHRGLLQIGGTLSTDPRARGADGLKLASPRSVRSTDSMPWSKHRSRHPSKLFRRRASPPSSCSSDPRFQRERNPRRGAARPRNIGQRDAPSDDRQRLDHFHAAITPREPARTTRFAGPRACHYRGDYDLPFAFPCCRLFSTVSRSFIRSPPFKGQPAERSAL